MWRAPLPGVNLRTGGNISSNMERERGAHSVPHRYKNLWAILRFFQAITHNTRMRSTYLERLGLPLCQRAPDWPQAAWHIWLGGGENGEPTVLGAWVEKRILSLARSRG